MTASGFLGSGGYNYQSPTMRSLGKITPESYDYRDQTKLISKLVGDVSFMGGMMRKMQKGIDDANKNFVQQIQSLINDVMVLFGGGGDTGLDFGDLKYVIQAIGALFGFGDGVLPINLFDAAWHFFSQYILPTENFTEVINQLLDNAIATVLDLFGEIPIVGQALQQLAVIIATIRDTLTPLTEALDSLFQAFGGDLGSGDLGPFGELWDTLMTLFGTITAPVAEALAPLWPLISEWTVPFVEGLTVIVEAVTNIIDLLTGGINSLDDFVGGAFNPVNILINVITNFINNGLLEGLDLSNILGPDSPLNALNLFNLGGLLGKIGIGNLTADTQELLDDPDFRDAITIQGGGAWVFDGSKGKTVPGSAKTIANGTLLQLMSNTIAVGEDDEIDPSVWAQWSGLTYTGTKPIKLEIVELLYSSVTETFATMGFVEIAAPSTPASNQATWTQLTSPYVVPANVSHVALQLRVQPTATAGTVWFDDASVKKTGQIKMPWVSGLSSALSGITSFAQGIIDKFLNAWGIPGTGWGLSDLFDIASAIPSGNILGFLGSNNIGTNIQDFIDTIMQGLGNAGTGWFFADLGQALGVIPPDNVTGAGGMPTVRNTFSTMWDFVTSALRLDDLFGTDINQLANASQDVSFSTLNSSILSGAHQVILDYRTNNPIFGAMERTAVANFPWTMLGTGATPTSIAVTQANSLGAVIRMHNADTKGTYFWRSITTGTVSGFYINIGRINDVTGAVDHVYQSPNIAGQLTTSWAWNYFQPDAIDRLVHGNDDGIIMEFQVVGSGTVTIAGQDFQWASDNFPGAITRKPGVTRATAGAHPTIALSGAQYTSALTTKTPWIALGRFDVPLTYHPPENWTNSGAGAFTYTIPSWARVAGTLIDWWAIGAGGGGQSGGYFVSAEGGAKGIWNSGTFVYGTDIPLGTTQLTGNVADNASGGINPFALDPGDNGGSTTINGVGGGFSTKTAAGGPGGGRAGNSWSQATGQGAGNRTVNGITQFGGAQAGVNSDGNTPGGGGGSGYPAVGRQGGEGKVFFRARQP